MGSHVVVFGRVYLDLVLVGMQHPPQLGREIYATDSALSPGGVANVAVALTRLGASVRLVSAVGGDTAGRFLLEFLAAEGVDCSRVAVHSGQRTPISVALSYPKDRAFVTHEECLPVELPPVDDPWWDGAHGFFATLGPGLEATIRRLAARGIACFGDTAWDVSAVWADEDLACLPWLAAFMANEVEALAYTRATDVQAALHLLAARTPVAVVKCGSRGALVGVGGKTFAVPAIAVEVVDTTGAGDVFNAGYIYGALSGRPVLECVRLGNLAAGLSVTRLGGSRAAPTWAEVETLVGQSAQHRFDRHIHHP